MSGACRQREQYVQPLAASQGNVATCRRFVMDSCCCAALQVEVPWCVLVPVLQLKQRREGLSHKPGIFMLQRAKGWGPGRSAIMLLHTLPLQKHRDLLSFLSVAACGL
jgi:hypothetical protein